MKTETEVWSLRRIILAAALLIGFAAQARADAESGWRAYLAGDHAAAVAELGPLAEAGEAQAQFYMGTLAEQGAGVPKDYGRALEWYALAAAQGHPGAQFALGLLYYPGAGAGAVARDPAAAARLMEAAARAGNAMAQHLMGRQCWSSRAVSGVTCHWSGLGSWRQAST